MKVEKQYEFDTDKGDANHLLISFSGRSQLMVYHFMFGPDFKAGCPTCSSIADGFNGVTVHLAQSRRDVLGDIPRTAGKAACV